VRPLAAGRIWHCQGHEVCVVAAQRSPQPLLWREFFRLQLWLRWCWKEQLLRASVSDRSGARTRAMHPGSVCGGVWCPSDARGTWDVGLVQYGLDLLSQLPAMFPASLEVADACVLVTIMRWPHGWPHGTDSLLQACNDAPQRAQAAGPGSDHILVDGSFISHHTSSTRERAQLETAASPFRTSPRLLALFFFYSFWRKKPYMSAKLAIAAISADS